MTCVLSTRLLLTQSSWYSHVQLWQARSMVMGTLSFESQTMPSSIARTSAAVVGTIAALALVSMFVLRTSSAVFTAQTVNSGNSLRAADVALSDNRTGTVLFNVADLNQTDSVSRCIQVSYDGSTFPTAGVKVYSGGFTDSGTLGDHLNVAILQGATGSTCTSTTVLAGSTTQIVSRRTLSTFGATASNYAAGFGTWSPVAAPVDTVRAYLITIDLDTATPNNIGGQTVSALRFTWEVTS